jgi:hypothetical protein
VGYSFLTVWSVFCFILEVWGIAFLL